MPIFQRMLTQLRSERDQLQQELKKLDEAIRAIEAVDSKGRGRVGRPPRAAAIPRSLGRMSTATRRKMSRLMKQRWAQGKMGKKASAKPTQASKPARRMSAAGRNRISQAAKRRWAEWRKRAKAA